ncbi:MAG: hypothetical protein JWL77_6472 [Chthonomonadaceae bacterium]|nr:hypothetical protein [Chthonomonadaceae bacterium]
MRCRLSVWILVLPVFMGLLGAAPPHTGEANQASQPPNLMQLRTQYGLTPEAEKMLLQNGFLVLDQVRYKTLGDAYPSQHHIAPMYVTTDAMLELWSALNRELLKSTERQVCIKQLSTLLPALETRAKTLYEAVHEEKERKALRQVLVTIAVSSRLLIAAGHNPVYPPGIRSEIDAQVQKVMAHREASEYPGEDYTQYTVRGHYADDAVLSYYEFTRKGLDRLTDAQWQAQQVQTYLRPEPPSWSYAFMAREGGAEWQAREPLRAAEKLLVDNRMDEALALLRATVAKNPDTTLATEAQFRLGRCYFDRHEFAQAERELRRCERLPGCDAFDQAQELLRQVQSVQQRRDYEQNVLAPARAKSLAELKGLRDAVEALKRRPPDASQERVLAQRLIRELPWEDGRNPWQEEVKALLRTTRAVCRTHPCQDAISFALLMAERGGRYGGGSREAGDREIAFSRQAASLPLRAAALCLALQDGYLADQPQAALALLRPFLDAHVLKNDTDPALQLILTRPDQTIPSGPSYTTGLRTDPKDLFRTQIAQTLTALASASLDAG